MAADKHCDPWWLKKGLEAVVSPQTGEGFCFASRRAVAEQHLAQTVDLKLERLRAGRNAMNGYRGLF